MYLAACGCILEGMDSGERWRLGHRPGLDGLRGVAILLVVASHALQGPFTAEGAAGVSVFFTLSGFLITALLLEESTRSGRVGLGAFYVRRARRLLPALLAFLAVMLTLGLTVSDRFATPCQVLRMLFYVGNWSSAFHGPPWHGGMGHTWSLAVEEQFYFVWPLVAIAVLRNQSRTTLLAVAVGGALVSLGLRLALWDGGSVAGEMRVYFGTDTAAFGLLVGCAVAIVMSGRVAGRSRPVLLSAALVAVAAAGLTGSTARFLFVPTVAPVLTAVALVALTSGSYSGWLNGRWIGYVGRRSYGLYLWHGAVFGVLLPVLDQQPQLVVEPALLALSAALTLASWRYVEAPFLHRQPRRVEQAVRIRGSSPQPRRWPSPTPSV